MDGWADECMNGWMICMYTSDDDATAGVLVHAADGQKLGKVCGKETYHEF